MRAKNREVFLMQEEELADFLWDNACYRDNGLNVDENRIPASTMHDMSDSLFGAVA